MSAHSVKLRLNDGGSIYISPRKARQLRKENKAVITSQQSFEMRLKSCADAEFRESAVQKWAPISNGVYVMSGALLDRKPPRP